MSKFDLQHSEPRSTREPNQVADPQRRKMLGKVAAASGLIAGAHLLPVKWAKPVLEKVVLPAHA